MEHILDLTGLGYFWGKIKNLFATGTAGRTQAIPFGRVDSTSTSTAYTATVEGITELKDGTCVYLMNGVVTSAANFTININDLGAKPSYNNMATGNSVTPTAPTRDTTIFNINYTMLFVYNSTLVDGGCWVCYRGYDANTNTLGYQLRTNSYVLNAADGFRYYQILFTSADGTKWVPSNSNKSNSATTQKTVNQTPINPFGEIVYCGNSTNYSSGSAVTATAIWQQYTVTLGYSFNTTGAALTLTTKKPVYVKCAPQANGSAIIDSTTPYVQDLPTTDDGKIYILLGMAYSATSIELLMVHPVYYHKDGAIRLWSNAAEPDLSGYQETIDDLDDIRAGAALGATALQSYTETDPTVPSWAKQSTKPSYTAQEVGALPSSTTIPTKVSDLTNDSGFTSNTGTITGITMNGASKGTSGVVNLGTVITSETALSKGTTSGSGNAVTDISVSGHQITLTKGSTFLTSHQDISGKADKSEMSVVAGTGANADKTTITLKSGTSATVLTSHQDISGKANVSALAGYTPTANFATINGASITGGGDVIITAGSSSITTIDAVPTKNSTNPVQSGGVYDAIEGGFYY